MTRPFSHFSDKRLLLLAKFRLKKKRRKEKKRRNSGPLRAYLRALSRSWLDVRGRFLHLRVYIHENFSPLEERPGGF
jgi:hypothetical protein